MKADFRQREKKTSQTWIGGISSPPKCSMKPWALTAVRTAHSTSEGHTSVCAGVRAGVVEAGSSSDGTEKEQKTADEAVLDVGGGEKGTTQNRPFQNKLCKVWAAFESEERRDEAERIRQPASAAEVAALCVPCNQEVTEMGLPCLRLPPTSPSEAARNVCGLVAAAPAGRSMRWCQSYTRERS